MRCCSALLLTVSFLLPSIALAFHPRIEEWTATGGTTTFSDDFEDGYVPGDPSDTGDTTPVAGNGCRAPEAADESGGSLVFKRPGGSPSCRLPDGRRTQAGFFPFLPSGDAIVRSTWQFAIPEGGEVIVVQLQNLDAIAPEGANPQRAYMIPHQFEGDVYTTLHDVNDVAFETALLGTAASLQAFSGVIEMEISLTTSGPNLLPHGRFRLCSPGCGNEAADPFYDLVDIAGAGDGAMVASEGHMPVITAVSDPPGTPALEPAGLVVLGAALLALGLGARRAHASAR